MFRTLAPIFVISFLILSFTPSTSVSSDSFRVEDCDELIALNGNNKGKMLCWYEQDNTKDIFTYPAKIYKNGKFSQIEDGEYVTRRHTRSFRGENGYALFHKFRAYLAKKNKTDPDIFADFYEANFEGLQRVFICNYDTEKKQNMCAPAQDGEYKTRADVTFKTERGFLPTGCSYQPHWNGIGKAALVCEDLD